MNEISITLSLLVCLLCFAFQAYYFRDTKKYRHLFQGFFDHKSAYTTSEKSERGLPQLDTVGREGSDLNKLIHEINHYVVKTKGTTDFAVIQNKVERMLNMRYDQSTACMAFPTYIGLMGTFSGVFLGIMMFTVGLGGEGITDDAISNLLQGVLVSMSTSFFGLLLTTINNARAGKARKKVEEDKNEFYDFVQTELMPSLDVSMIAAISRLHNTIDRFEPAFDCVINRFQTTFDRCTAAFGHNFEKNVTAVTNAVKVMGENVDKYNYNIELQEKLLANFKSNKLIQGLEKYIEAADHFADITRSLDLFEEARRMMLAAAQEAIAIQNEYNRSLQIPRNIAIQINKILDRITNFETNVNQVGEALALRGTFTDKAIKAIEDQVKAIARKGTLAERYLEMSDDKLEDLYREQLQVIARMGSNYREALEKQINDFKELLREETEQMKKHHQSFVEALDERLSIDEVKGDFSNLKKLDSIDRRLNDLNNESVKPRNLKEEISRLKQDINALNRSLNAINETLGKANKKASSWLFNPKNWLK